MKRRCKETGNIKWNRTERGWVAKFQTAWGERSVSTGTHDKRAAVRMAERVKLEYKQTHRFERKVVAAFVSDERKVTCENGVQEWAKTCIRHGTLDEITVVKRCEYLRAFLNHCGCLKDHPAAVSEEHVALWVNPNSDIKASTRRLRLLTLRIWFDWLIAKGYTSINPASVVRRINLNNLTHEQLEVKHKVPFTNDEIGKLLDYIDAQVALENASLAMIDPRFSERSLKGYSIRDRLSSLTFWKLAIQIAYHTGLRLGDIAELEWASVADPARLVKWTSKTNVRVDLPVIQELSAVLAQISKIDERWCFPDQCRINCDMKTRARLPKQFIKLCGRVGIAGKSFHCIRATRAVAMQDQGQPISAISQSLGHRSTEVTQVYLGK